MSKIIYIKDGDIFESRCETIVNPVNCVGVMGSGLALEFKKRLSSDYYDNYVESCRGELRPGCVCSYFEDSLDKFIVNFPTKFDWRNPSNVFYIERGLCSLVDLMCKIDVKSVALPAIGCGLGGLSFKDVKRMIVNRFEFENFYVEVYLPRNGD